jgi:NADH-quinone oxidoreductase subunit B
VIDGFLALADMIRKGEAVGYKKYRLNYDWYKRNQDEVLGRTSAVLEEVRTEVPAAEEKVLAMEGVK